MKFNHPKNLLTSLSILFISLFLSCNQDDLLEETEALYAPKLTATTTNTVTLTPIQDAHLTGNTRYNLPILGVSENYRIAHLMFDLSKIEGEITSATLQYTIKDNPGNGRTRVFTGTHTNWTESNLTDQNRPKASNQLGYITKSYPVGSTHKINLTTKHLINERMTIIMWQEDGQGYTFASRETTTPPKLIVTYSTTTSSGSTARPGVVAPGYYVSTTGKATNNGLSESSAWSLQHAFRAAKAGDIVYIKAGNYGNLELTISNSGIAGKPIKFIGYKRTPGDIVSNNGSTYTYEDYKSNSNSLNAAEMPLLQGKRSNMVGTGIAIRNYKKDYIHLENFMIRHYEYGIFSQGKHTTFKNIISSDHGDFHPSRSYLNGTKELHANLTGNGIWITATENMEMIDCLAINNGARGISIISTTNSTINNNKVYSDNNINPTDYYILLYRSNSNKLNNNLVKRVGNLSHPGHGIGLKVDSNYNTFTNCRAEGTSFELNNRVSFNTFKDCHVEGQGITQSGGWKITNYSHDNEFINCSNNRGEGIMFADWVEGDGNNGINTAAFNNTFRNCTITNIVTHSGAIIDFNWNNSSGQRTSYARNNQFIDCTFSGAKSLFKVDRVNQGNKIINCKLSNIEQLRMSKYSKNNDIKLNVEFSNTSAVKNVGFKIPNK